MQALLIELMLMVVELDLLLQVDSTIVMTESGEKRAEIVAANQEEAKPVVKLSNDPACSHV